MNLAYIISAYTDPPQLQRLVKALHPDAHFFIHIDRKSDIQPFQALLQGENIHFLSERADVRWGTIRQVDFQMALLKAAIDHPVTFDHIFMLTGQDYPIWSNARITHWLAEQGEREQLCGACVNREGPTYREQRKLYQSFRPLFDLPHLSARNNLRLAVLYRKMRHVIGQKKPLWLTVDGQRWDLYKGSDYWCISEQLAKYIYNMYNTHPEIRRYFADSFAPSETLIQTIAFNSPQWAERCMLRKGEYPGLVALTPLHFIIYSGAIRIMQDFDYSMLIDSGKMFVRKLQSGRSDSLITLLDQHRKEEEATFSTPSPH